MSLNVDRTFVLHHKTFVERKETLLRFLLDNRIEVEWVEKFLPEEIESQFSQLVGDFKIDPSCKPVCQGQYEYYENAGRLVTVPELSLYLKHKYCIEKQLQENYENILVFEDDAKLRNYHVEFINRCLAEFETLEGDLMFLGSCCNIHVRDAEPGRYVYLRKNQLTRCSHAYVVNMSAAEIISKRLYPVNWPYDFKLNEIIIRENLRVCWSEPCIYQNRNFPTSIQNSRM